MGKLQPTDFYLYRWRFFIGYAIVIVLLALFLLFVGQNVPGAITGTEMNAVVKSTAIDLQDPSAMAITSLPYHLLQRASIELFGVTIIGIKLPSLILSFITAIGAVLLLRRWFRPSVALLATILLVTTGQFLFVSQSGAPGIMYMLWSVWLLLAATMMTNKEASYPLVWRILFFVLVGLSLYTPLSLYLIIAIIAAALLHPHVRYVLKRMNGNSLLLLTIVAIVLVAPLGYLISERPALGLELLGKPAEWPPQLLENGWQLLRQYFDFFNPQARTLMVPVFGFGALALIILGAWQLVKNHHNARSYTIAAWILLLIPVLLINPMYTSITFVPFLLLMASGLDFLMRSWYGIFPRNPYARAVGLIPMIVLVGGLVISAVDRYVYGYHYSPEIVSNFSRDITLINDELKATKEPVSLVVGKEELGFYTIAAQHASQQNKTSIGVSDSPQEVAGDTATVIVSKNAQPAYVGQEPLDIITTSASRDADRFYIYKNSGQ